MKYTVAEYIVARLKALGVRHLFQVPGNYISDFLQTAQASGAIQCINTTNELEAGYAADAYARLNGVGVACVTLGVGSFSAYNAIAGSFVEFCPVLLLNGSARKSKLDQMLSQGVLYAHAIDRERTDELVFRPITTATSVITSGENASAEVDRVLRTMLTTRRPVYLEVHDLVWTEECQPPEEPNTPLQPYALTSAEESDVEIAVLAAANAVAGLLSKAKKPVLWGGEELQRLGLERYFADIVKLTNLPYATTLMGKGLIPESTDGFIGVYDSNFASKEVRAVVEDTDLLVALGTILGDFYGTIVQKQFTTMVLASTQSVRTGSNLYTNVPLDRFLPALLDTVGANLASGEPRHEKLRGYTELQENRKTRKAIANTASQSTVRAEVGDENEAAGSDLTWDSFFARLRGFIQPEMLVLADTSMALFPSAELPVLKQGHFIAQTVWLSIGYTLGGIVGASHWLPEGERAVAIAGDGGFQMLPQALSTLARYRKPAIIFVCDNGLYGIEQFLIDANYYANPEQAPVFFNQLFSWDYAALARAFGAWGLKVTTLAELEEALDEVLAIKNQPALIAVKLSPKDLPDHLRPRPAVHGGAGLMAQVQTVLAKPLISVAAFD
jgi:indolepyruvate decarboxylase